MGLPALKDRTSLEELCATVRNSEKNNLGEEVGIWYLLQPEIFRIP